MKRHISKKLRFLLLLLLFSIAKAFPIAPGCFKICPRSYRPVCASDSRTYGNQCLFDIVKCSKKISVGIYIYVKHEGFCSPFSSSYSSSSSSSLPSPSLSSSYPHYQRPVDLFSNFNGNGRRSMSNGGGDNNDNDIKKNNKVNDGGGGRIAGGDGTATRNAIAHNDDDNDENGNSVESLFVRRLGELKLSWGDPVSNRVWQPVAPNEDVANWWHPSMTSRNKLAREQALKLGSEADASLSGRSGSSFPSSSCKRFCSKVYNPVCGTDGVTYFNPCRLEIEDCLNGTRWGRRKIRVAVKGPCLGADWLARARRRRR